MKAELIPKGEGNYWLSVPDDISEEVAPGKTRKQNFTRLIWQPRHYQELSRAMEEERLIVSENSLMPSRELRTVAAPVKAFMESAGMEFSRWKIGGIDPGSRKY